MGLLFVGVLAGILIGFGVFAPSHGYFLPSYAAQPVFDKTVSGRHPEPMPTALRPAAAIAKTAPAAPTKSGKSSQPRKLARLNVGRMTPPRTKTSVAASVRPAEQPDPVLSKAKVAIAAKMEDPGSAEFSDMKRAMRKNTFGRPVDTVCGHVKGKSASGGETGERPFLYLVKEDDAYVVDGRADSAASIAYRNICN